MAPTGFLVVKPTGTFRWSDGAAFGDGSLVITEMRPWLYPGYVSSYSSFTMLDTPPATLPVTSGVIDHTGGNIYIHTPVTARFTLYNTSGVAVQTWSGLFNPTGSTYDAINLATWLNAMKTPASVEAKLRPLLGSFRCMRFKTSGCDLPSPLSMAITCLDNLYDTADTYIILNGPTLGSAIQLVLNTNVLEVSSGSIYVPVSGTGHYRFRITDESTSPATVYFDQSGLSIASRADGPVTGPKVGIVRAGNVDSGYHYWAVTCINAAGEESYLGLATIGLCAGDKEIALTNIPLGPTGTTARKVYRTKHYGGVEPVDGLHFFCIATISDNVTTKAGDNIADADLPLDFLIYPDYVDLNTIIPPFMV